MKIYFVVTVTTRFRIKFEAFKASIYGEVSWSDEPCQYGVGARYFRHCLEKTLITSTPEDAGRHSVWNMRDQLHTDTAVCPLHMVLVLYCRTVSSCSCLVTNKIKCKNCAWERRRISLYYVDIWCISSVEVTEVFVLDFIEYRFFIGRMWKKQIYNKQDPSIMHRKLSVIF